VCRAYYAVAVVCLTGVFYVLISYPYRAGCRIWGMVKLPHLSSLFRSPIFCDTHLFFVLLVNITPHLLSRRPRPILRNSRGSRTSKNTTEFCLTLFISQDAVFILIYHLCYCIGMHGLLRLSHHSFCSSFILSCILHYSVTFNPIPWIIPKKSLVQLLMLLFRIWNNSHHCFIQFYTTVC